MVEIYLFWTERVSFCQNFIFWPKNVFLLKHWNCQKTKYRNIKTEPKHRKIKQIHYSVVHYLKVTFVNMTGRCGSTLLSQMISRTPRTRTMSEPWSLVHIHGHFNQRLISMAEYKRLLRNVVRLLCKPEKRQNVEHVFIKTTMLMSPAFPMLKEMFPQAKFIFNTRCFRPSMESAMKLSKGEPVLFNYSGALFQANIGHS